MSVSCQKEFSIVIDDVPSPSGPTPALWWPMEESGNSNRVDAVSGVILTASADRITGGGPVPGSWSNGAGRVGLAASIERTGLDIGILGNMSNGSIPGMGLTPGGNGITVVGWYRQLTNAGFNYGQTDISFGWGTVEFSMLSTMNDPTNSFTTSIHRAGNPIDTLPPPDAFVSADWTFFRLWYDIALGECGIQFNNGIKGTVSSPGASFGTTFDFQIDVAITDPSATGETLFDEVAVFVKNISDAEASFLYNGGAGRTYPY